MALSSRRQLLLAIVMVTFTIAFGTIGYVVAENYTLNEALYMTVITVTTVGFGEVRPLSETGRALTSMIILLGFASLAVAGRAFTEAIYENMAKDELEARKMKRTIDRLRGHTIVCGYGRVGAAAVAEFRSRNADFVVVEIDPSLADQFKNEGILCVEGDAAGETTLLEAGIKRAGALMSLLPTDPGNLLVVLSARELNPTLHITTRAEDDSSVRKILQAGADEVVAPFSAAGRKIADNTLAALGLIDPVFAAPSGDASPPAWIDIPAGSPAVGATLERASLILKRNIAGLRRGGSDTILPARDTILEPGDRLLVFGEVEGGVDDMDTGRDEHPALVIVDDNPVIRRLYTRYFQKHGFSPHAASNGRDGLEMILREKPAAAVVDYMMPVLSGIEICEAVRATEGCESIKLILFTADEDGETRERALAAGADAVVYKSPEIGEVVEKVRAVLEESHVAVPV